MNLDFSILDEVEALRISVQSGVGYYIGWGKVIASIGILYFVLKTYNTMQSEGRFIESSELFRVLFLTITLLFYGSFMGGVDGLMGGINNSLKVASSESGEVNKLIRAKEIEEERKRIEEKKKEISENPTLSTSGWEKLQNKWEKIKDDFNESFELFYVLVESESHLTDIIMESIFRFFAGMAISVLAFIRSFFLIVLYLLGPLAAGFSLFPGFENTFVNWLKKYLTFSLWLPVSYILEIMLIKLYHIEGISSILLFLCIILGFFLVPRIAEWIITSGANTAASKMKSVAKTK